MRLRKALVGVALASGAACHVAAGYRLVAASPCRAADGISLQPD